ncbi:AMP-binding protein [Marinobacterium sp. AK62]|uniref:AMP-binding protein n=1 Tax=Marinobacterium alkalitolerans TaxID=1542925 RepID=A0ABS3Z7K4_9GAMM|nr:AMP-binding protein [Marinobacterium alkalitolerans]MBP0047693.1 AMP-binding protein [Marinobacterium alkalitolerans]
MPEQFFAQLESLARTAPEACALSDARESISWGALPERIAQMRHWLEQSAGTRIALLADNSCQWVLLDLAAMQLGIPLIPIPLFFSAQQRAHLLAQAGIDTLVSEQQGILRAESLQALPAELHPGTAKITFTSGTTGNPKGVCLSSAQQLAVARSLAEHLSGLKIQRHLCLLPLATLLENVAGVYTALLMGAEVQLPSLTSLGWEGSSALNASRLIQVLTSLTGQLTHASALTDLKFVAVGGARVGPDLIQRARALGIPAYEGYGLSECGSVVSVNTPSRDLPGSAGQPLPHNTLVVTPEGELKVEGNVMLGYLGEPAHEGFFATGDRVALDASGFLHVQGRWRNVFINSYGRNLSPEWVESELLALQGVQEAVLFGDGQPCNAALLHAPGLSDHQLAQHLSALNARLPDYARIKHWARTHGPLKADPALYTPNGRPRRDAIAQQYAHTLESFFQPEQGNTHAVL